MNLNNLKGHRDLVSIHNHMCKDDCGLCCFVQPFITIGDLNFIPVAEKLEGIDETDKKYLSLFVCEHLDIETKKCKIYTTRPVECRKFFCKGNPRPQVIQVKGESVDAKNK